MPIFDHIEGFYNPDETALLQRYALAAKGVMVEIGSYRGRTTLILADGARYTGNILYAIDPHEAISEAHEGGAVFQPADNVAYMHNVADYGDVVKTINLPSEMVAQIWSGAIWLLFIDGSHVYEDVKRDFEDWSPFVTGFIAMHDTTTIEDVARVLAEVIASGEWEIVDRADSTTVLKRVEQRGAATATLKVSEVSLKPEWRDGEIVIKPAVVMDVPDHKATVETIKKVVLK